MVVMLNNNLMELTEFQHVKPGKGGAFVRTKLKNVLTGRVLEKTFRSGERMEEVRLVEDKYEYLYTDGDIFHFMNKETYDQIEVGSAVIGDSKDWMTENMDVGLLFHDANVISISLPNTMVLKIAQADPGVQGDRAQGGTKPAQLETGVTVQVPLFVNKGESIKVDTRTRQYIERA